MPSIINASSSGSGGLVQTADASGVLQLQSNGSVGFTVGSTAVASGSSSATVGPFTNSSLGTFNGYLQIGSNLQLMSFANGTTNTQTQLTSNAYYSGAYRAIAGGAGASKLFIGGAGTFEFAGSNTLTSAGDIITFVPTLACGSLGQTVALQGASSVNGIGITFPASASVSTNPNTLDDYEEGTWTPTAPVGLSVSTAVYQKVGNTVYINAFINVNSNSSTAELVITGMPFALASGSSSVGCFNNDNQDLYAYMDAMGVYIRTSGNVTRTCADTSGNFVAFQMSYLTTA
jgi:hypothetical protein